MSQEDCDSYSDQELLEALDEALDPTFKGSTDELRLKLKPLLTMIVHRIVETAQVFNEHQHQVQVSSTSSEYERSGSGVTESPCKRGGYGCHSRLSIGEFRKKKEDD